MSEPRCSSFLWLHARSKLMGQPQLKYKGLDDAAHRDRSCSWRGASTSCIRPLLVLVLLRNLLTCVCVCVFVCVCVCMRVCLCVRVWRVCTRQDTDW